MLCVFIDSRNNEIPKSVNGDCFRAFWRKEFTSADKQILIIAKEKYYDLFIPLAMAEDRFAMQRQYWFYKIAPIGGKTFAGSLYLSHFLPALILALALIIPVNYFTDFASAGILQMALLTLLLVSSGALQQLTMLMEVSSIGEEATLFSRIAREATILYFPLFMLPLAISFYYRYIGLLSFMHGLPQPAVIVFAALITAILATVVTWQSFRNMTTIWQNMEIK